MLGVAQGSAGRHWKAVRQTDESKLPSDESSRWEIYFFYDRGKRGGNAVAKLRVSVRSRGSEGVARTCVGKRAVKVGNKGKQLRRMPA